MFMKSTMQFQQATQSTLQANTKAITKVEMQMGQLATSRAKRRKFSSQSVANPKSQFEIEASSHNKHVKFITTLRNGKTVDNHIDDPEIVEIQMDEDETPVTNENISKSPEPPTSTFFRDESINAYISRAPYPQRLTGSTRK